MSSVSAVEAATRSFPTPLDAYPPPSPAGLLSTLLDRVHADPWNAVATTIFVLAIVHTFLASRFSKIAHDIQHRHDERARSENRAPRPSVAAEILHFFGEVEVVFGLWAVVLFVALTLYEGWDVAAGYLNHTVNYTEPLFVVAVMALASTRPIIGLARGALSRVAALGRGTPLAWWFAILTLGPLLGSLITEPAAMTICAILLGRQFYDLSPSPRLKYATLGLLFVNVSIGGTLTHFAAPPILMVARTWEWDTAFLLEHFGWRAVLGVFAATVAYSLIFRKELRSLAARPDVPDPETPEPGLDPREPGEEEAAALLPVPAWVALVHVAFMAWTVYNSHTPVLFLGGLLFFLGFVRATARYQSEVELKGPILVGFFLAGLVIHGGLQGWWIAPVLASLNETPLFFGAALLTAFNDNALITYLATLVPNLPQTLEIAVVQGAVTGGGLTVIANAPNPAGQTLLSRFFDGGISPLKLLLAALLPTLLASIAFRMF